MGHLIKTSKIRSSKSKASNSITVKRVLHKAKVLTAADVEANRSTAYTYLTL